MNNNRWQKSFTGNTYRDHSLHASMIEAQETQSLPILLTLKPTLTELRKHCHMEVCEVARKSGVRPYRVYLMEHGSLCAEEDVWRVLMVLSHRIGQVYHTEDMRDLHVKFSR